MALSPGTQVGGYHIVGAIGAGGMGEVYRARDPRLGRDVAIKVIPAAFSSDPERLQRFEQEARAAAALNHPNILTVHGIGTHDGAPFVVSELLEGQTLRQALADGALPVRKALDVAVQVANGLAAAHEKNIVHRDLKPENIFLTRDNRVKILDFGLAKLTEREAAHAGATVLATRTVDTGTGMVLGTVGYMSPEQVRGEAVDSRSDIFSFGAVLYELVSGARAFKGDTDVETLSAILKQDPPDIAMGDAVVPPALALVVRHCLEKDPAERFQSARIATALSQDGRTVLVTDQGSFAGLTYSTYLRRLDQSEAVRLGDGQGADLSPDGQWALSITFTKPSRIVLLATGAGRNARAAADGNTARVPDRLDGRRPRHVRLVGHGAAESRVPSGPRNRPPSAVEGDHAIASPPASGCPRCSSLATDDHRCTRSRSCSRASTSPKGFRFAKSAVNASIRRDGTRKSVPRIQLQQVKTSSTPVCAERQFTRQRRQWRPPSTR